MQLEPAGKSSLRRFLLLTAAASAGLAALASSHSLAQSTWINSSSSDWNTAGNWNPSAVPASGTTTILDFATGGTYISTDDIAGAFSLNQLNFDNPAGTVTLNASPGGNYLLFGGTAPSINVLGTGNVTLGMQISGGAALIFTGTGVLTVTGNDTYTGATNYSSGITNYSGSASSLGVGSLTVGAASGSQVMNVNTIGTLTFSTVTLGAVTGASGSIIQNSGTFNYNTSGTYLNIGNAAGSYGFYQLSGGTLNGTTSGGIKLATNGAVGVYYQTGGTLTVNKYFDQNYAGGSTGISVATFTGGTLNGAAAYPINVDDNSGSGPSMFNLGTLAGGNAQVVSNDATANGGGVQITSSNNTTSLSNATLNLNSGTLLVNAGGIYALFKSGGSIGTATLNLNGATVKAGASGLTLISGGNNLQGNVYNGGITFDTQSYNANVSSNLVTTTGQGIYKTATFAATPGATAGAGYTGMPAVIVSGGGGTGAQAIANINSAGQITGFTMTSPGQGYTSGSTLTFTLSGGGAAAPASPYSYSLQPGDLAANGAGGLTKLGSGTLTLTGSNTYGGPTVIKAGVLNAGNAAAIPTGSTIQFAGGSLQYSSASASMDYSSQFSTAPGQNYSIDTSGQNVSFSTPLAGATNSLTKLGTGTLSLNAIASFGGPTNINAGTFALTPAGGLGNTAITVAPGATFAPQSSSGSITIGTGAGSLNVAGGGTLNMVDDQIEKLKLVNTAGATALTLGSATGSPAVLDFELGQTSSTVDSIAVTGIASVLSSGASIAISPLAADTSLSTGDYTLITAGGGLGANMSLLTQSVSVNSVTYDLSLSHSTGTSEILTVRLDANPTNIFWAGTYDNNWSTISSGSTNWQTSGGANTAATPGTNTNVYFSAASVGRGGLNTVLGSDTTINSLTFNSSASGPVSIAAGNTLTIKANNVNGNAAGNGILLNPGSPAVTINANVTMAAAQTWTNNASNPLTVNGTISDGSIISGGVALTTAGTGTITLAGSNTFSGGLNVSGGTLNLNNAAAPGTGTMTISGPAVIDNTTGAPITLNNNPQAWNSSFTFNGSNDLNLGTGQVTVGTNIQVTLNVGNLTAGGTVADGGVGNTLTTAGPGNLNVTGGLAGALGLTVNGPGTVNLTGANSNSGPTNISGGTVNFTGNASSTGNSVFTVGALSGGGVVNINTTGTIDLASPCIGGTNNSSGAVNQTNGNVIYTNVGGYNFLFIGGELSTGNPPSTVGNYGSYVLAGGTLTNPTGVSTGIEIGNNGGLGVFTQTGGTLSLNRSFYIGNGYPGVGFGTFTGGTAIFNGGNINFGAHDGIGGELNVGTEAGGTANITVGAGEEIFFTGNAILNSAVNLNKGTITFTDNGIVESGTGGTAMVNLNGITIASTASIPNLIDASLNATGQGAYVYNGGVTFNTASGTTSVVGANLQGAAGNGIYKNAAFAATPTGTTGAGYIGAPLVAVSGGSGTGAMAIATVDTNPGDSSYGQITGFTLTNPGQNYSVGDTLTFIPVGGGATTLADPYSYTLTAADLLANNAGGLNKTGAGTLTLTGTNTYSGPTNVRAGTLVIGALGALPAGNKVTVASGAVLVADSEATIDSVSSLNVSGSVIVHNGNLQTLNSDVGTGYANGTWTGAGGITSSAAAADTSHLTALAVIQNDDGTGSASPLYTSFEGQTVSDSDVLVKYTYYGDTNLDGKVDGGDYSRVDNGYLNHLTGWFNGDFNYDGVVNGSDYTLIDNAFNSQGGQIAAQIAAETAQIAPGAGSSAVPEPAALGMVGMTIAGLLGRRRRAH
jgi:autotransporter-associated beta strand protein